LRPRSTRSTSRGFRGWRHCSRKWATNHGFLRHPTRLRCSTSTPSQPDLHAARFDASRAARLNQNSGDGTPIMVTIRPRRPGFRCASQPRPEFRQGGAGRRVPAHRSQPDLLAGGRGLSLDRNEPANDSLLSDLRPTSTWGGFPPTCGVTLPESSTCRRAISTTTSRSAPDPRRSIAAGCRCDGSEARRLTALVTKPGRAGGTASPMFRSDYGVARERGGRSPARSRSEPGAALTGYATYRRRASECASDLRRLRANRAFEADVDPEPRRLGRRHTGSPQRWNGRRVGC